MSRYPWADIPQDEQQRWRETTAASTRLLEQVQNRFGISTFDLAAARDLAIAELLSGTPEVFNVKAFGAVGDGVTNDVSAIQAAIDQAAADGGSVFFPAPDVHYRIVGSLQLYNDASLFGSDMWRGTRAGAAGNHTLVGDGVNPVFRTGIYPGGDGSANRNITIRDLSARNNGAEVIQFYTAQNFKLIRCSFASYSFADATKGTVDIRYSYRGTIQDCNIVASGGAWAISAYDNCNSLNGQNNILTGGSLGGLVDIGQSQVVRFNGTTAEVSLYGFRIGALGVTGGGICNGVNLDDNYLEQVGRPYEIGTGFIVRGLSIQRGYIGNTPMTLTESPYFTLGRVQGWKIGGGISIGRVTAGTAEIFDFQYSASAPNYATGGEATDIYYTGGTGAWYRLTSFPSAVFLGRIAGQNRIQPTISGPISGARTYESPTITANVGRPLLGVISPHTYGGEIERIEVIEATGTLGCTVDIGTTTSATEIASFDPSALALTSGAGTATVTGALMRPGLATLLRVTAGAGTGSFRVRIVYKAGS